MLLPKGGEASCEATVDGRVGAAFLFRCERISHIRDLPLSAEWIKTIGIPEYRQPWLIQAVYLRGRHASVP
jgi:hypothetical protein